jgi:hypothetical protein
MALEVDLSRAIRTAARRRELIVAVRDADPHENEKDWVEWKGAVDLSKREWKFEIARQILGFRNRDPDRAAQTLEGVGYLLLGVEPGDASGIDPIDPAQLEDTISEYLGRSGPEWDADYETIGGATVLVITAEAPRWSDPIFCLQKEFGKYPNGYIAVRRFGKTVQANAADVAMLADRAARRDRTETLGINVAWADDARPITAVDLSDAARESWLEDRRALLLPDAPDERLVEVGLETGETRDLRTFRNEVETYLGQVSRVWREMMIEDAVKNRLGEVTLHVENLTEHNFEAVKVELSVDGDVWSFATERDAELDTEPPRMPAPWGRLPKRSAWPGLHVPASIVPLQSFGPRPYTYNSDSTHVVFPSFHLRPHYHEHLDPVQFVVPATRAGEELVAAWQATSTSVSGVATGSFALPVKET